MNSSYRRRSRSAFAQHCNDHDAHVTSLWPYALSLIYAAACMLVWSLSTPKLRLGKGYHLASLLDRRRTLLLKTARRPSWQSLRLLVEQQEKGLDRSDFLHYCFHLSHFALWRWGIFFLRMVQKRNSIMDGADGGEDWLSDISDGGASNA